MRLFVAIDLSDEVRAAVADLQHRLRASVGGGSLRWVRPEQVHLTLVFIGERDPAQARAIAGSLAEPLARDPFALALGSLGVFPPQGAPRVLWVGLAAGAAEVVDVQRLVAARLAGVGVPPDARTFHPHLTLARWRASRPSDRRRVPADVASRQARMTVRAVTLYHSELGPSGSSYTALMQAPLGCR